MPSLATFIALGLAVVAVFLLIAAMVALVRRRFFRSGTSLIVGLVLLVVALLVGSISIGTQGYRSFTREDVAATITTRPLGDGRFEAVFLLPGQDPQRYELAGDELYIDAHILKWKPIANLFGLHTGYELDRVAGRYRSLDDEQKKPRTIHSLAGKKPVDMFTLRSQYPFLGFLVDAQYGSATFVPTSEAQTFELRVSTTGLLIRLREGTS